MGFLTGTSGSFEKTKAYRGDGCLRLSKLNETSPAVFNTCSLEPYAMRHSFKSFVAQFEKAFYTFFQRFPGHTCPSPYSPQVPYLNKCHHVPNHSSQKSRTYLWFLPPSLQTVNLPVVLLAHPPKYPELVHVHTCSTTLIEATVT